MNVPISLSNTQPYANLRVELDRVCQEITIGEGEDALYATGLVKSLIAVRLQIMRTTKALIEQRLHALEAGAPVTLVVQAANPDYDRANQLENELATQSQLAQQARAEASLCAGGLVHSLKLSTVATHEQTLASLRQQYLLAKYGLVLPVLEQGTVSVRETGDPTVDRATTYSL